MKTYNNKDLIRLTEFGQYLKSVFEFCILEGDLKNIEIKWNIQWLDYSILIDKEEEAKEFFLEIVFVLDTFIFNSKDKDAIIHQLEKFFTIEIEQPTFKEIDSNIFFISKLQDTEKERFTLINDNKYVPEKFKKFEVSISIESMLRNEHPSAKLILSSDDLQREEEKLIEELITERTIMQEKFKSIQQPIIICEGKTDLKIIETAWKKLYPDKQIPFKIIPSGRWLELEGSEGGARDVSQLLNLFPNISEDKIYIGLFDNDEEGNNQFEGLDKRVFEKYDEENIIRCHRNKNIYGMLLPVPEFRKNYFGTRHQRYFTIEHYFSDEILRTHRMIGDKISKDSQIFRIAKKKDNFAKAVEQLDKNAFEDMTILFEELNKLIS